MTQRFFSATRATFLNEIRLLGRDPFCVFLLACFSIGLTWASWNSYRVWRDFTHRQSELQAAAREAWLSQTTTNAHMATHVGQTVYKPVSPLTGFDPGTVADFGSAIFLQSHYQSAATDDPRPDEVDLLQNEAYSPAVLLQLIGPLLLIVLGNASIAREMEGGTLSMLLTTGSSWPAIISGKMLAVLLALFIVALPGLLLFTIPWFERNPWLPTLNLLVRESLILLTLSAYFVGWLGVTMLVASKSKSTVGSFSILIALWSVIALVMPRVAGDVASFVSPLPTHAEIKSEKESAVQEANQSSIEIAKANQALEQRLLEEFNVDRIEDLPIDLAGARMIDQEASTNRLYDEVEQRVKTAKSRQTQLISGFQWASPYLAMRSVSTSFSATHRAHHFDFENSAESYRRQFVEVLNRAEMERLKPGETPQERRQFWARVPEFLPNFVPAVEDVKRSSSALICLLAWATAMTAAAFLASPQINRVR